MLDNELPGSFKPDSSGFNEILASSQALGGFR
jgi:hypothetical protein